MSPVSTSRKRGPNSYVAALATAVLFALAVYQEVHDGRVDKFIIGSLLVLALGLSGRSLDLVIAKWLGSKKEEDS